MGCAKLTYYESETALSENRNIFERGIRKSVRTKKMGLNYYAFGMQMPGRNYGSDSYRYGFNGKEKDDEVKGSGNQLDFGARGYDPRIGRWLSLDPLMAKYPSLSPYNFAGDNPVLYVDTDGKDNVIYLVYLPSDENSLSLADAQCIAEQATTNFQNLGVCTQVVLVDMSNGKNQDFNPNELDKTDATAVLGTYDDVINYITSYDCEFGAELSEEWKGGTHNPEHSENNRGNGKFIAIDAPAIKTTGIVVMKGTDNIKAGALIVNHGAGHTAGQNHFRDKTERQSLSPIMYDGDRLRFNLGGENYPTVDEILTNRETLVGEQNADYKRDIKKRYGDNTPTQTYEPE